MCIYIVCTKTCLCITNNFFIVNKSNFINRIEHLRRHMKINYENEIKIENDGQPHHDPCISHCLAYAFGICTDLHETICSNCNEFWILFKDLYDILGETSKNILEDAQDKLIYYLSHQTRKVYLNFQFTFNLRELDYDGAVLLVDYKMRILPKSARETKEEFFGKKGWTLHSILLYTKNQEDTLEINAYDHWSNDTKQDAWFTASSLHAVITSLEKKPK
jgi:hypothetical protein